MRPQVDIVAWPGEGRITSSDNDALAAVLGPLSQHLDWSSFSIYTNIDLEDHYSLFIPTLIQQEEPELRRLDVYRCVALGLALSLLQPGWVVEIRDDLGLVETELGIGILRLRGGEAVERRPDSKDPMDVLPAPELHQRLLETLRATLKEELAHFERPGMLVLLPARPTAQAKRSVSEPPRPVSQEERDAWAFSLHGPVPGAPPQEGPIRVEQIAVELQPPDDDGDVYVQGKVRLYNASDETIEDFRMLMVLRDAEGQVLRTEGSSQGLLGPGEIREVSESCFVSCRSGRLASVDLLFRIDRIHRHEDRCTPLWLES